MSPAAGLLPTQSLTLKNSSVPSSIVMKPYPFAPKLLHLPEKAPVPWTGPLKEPKGTRSAEQPLTPLAWYCSGLFFLPWNEKTTRRLEAQVALLIDFKRNDRMTAVILRLLWMSGEIRRLNLLNGLHSRLTANKSTVPSRRLRWHSLAHSEMSKCRLPSAAFRLHTQRSERREFDRPCQWSQTPDRYNGTSNGTKSARLLEATLKLRHFCAASVPSCYKKALTILDRIFI